MSRNLLARARFVVPALLILACYGPRRADAQLPVARMLSIFPSGAKQGSTLEVHVQGVDLDDAKQLQFSDPGITAAQKMVDPGLGQTGPQVAAGQFSVTIGAEVKPGTYEVRAVGKYGISNPRLFTVGTQPEMVEIEPNNNLKTATEVPLGTVVNAQSASGADLDFFKFAAKAGQRVIIDCVSQRIDSRMDATLILFDAGGTELARDRDTNRHDPLLDFTVPKDGEYFVEVHDFLYGGSNELFYRLSIGVGPYLDFVFPPAGQAGSQNQYTLFGRNLPGGTPADGVQVAGKALEKLTVPIAIPADKAQELVWGAPVEAAESGIDAIDYRLTAPQGISNPLLVSVAGANVVAENEPNDDPAKAQPLTLPCEVAGQFYPRADQDWFSFEAKQGEVYWIEVFSQRLGLPTDPLLLVQQMKKDDKGEVKAVDVQASDDGAASIGATYYDTTSDDPLFRLAVPADGTYRVMVRDLYGASRSDPRLVYRLTIRPPQPDFRLIAEPRLAPTSADPNQNQPAVWNPLLRKGGSELIEVMAFRREGFDGEIQVTAQNLPAGVTAAPVTIGPGQTAAPLVLVAAENAAESVALISVLGKAQIGQAEVTHAARAASVVWGGVQNMTLARSRISRNLAVAVSAAETAAYTVDPGANLVIEMSRMGTIKFPVNVVRRGEFKGAVVLSAFGLPPNVQPTNNNNVAADKTAADFEIKLPNNAPLGTYTFFVAGVSDVPYAHNPEALAVAVERKTVLEKLSTDDAAAAKAAADAKAAAEKALADATAANQKAAEAAKAGEKNLADAQAAATAATTKAAEAQAALDKDTANQGLIDAKQAAVKVVEEADVKLKAAAEAKTGADKAATDADAALKQATEAKTVADKTAVDSDNKAKQVAAFLNTFNQQLAEIQKKSKTNNVKVATPSASVTLKITAAPITVEVAPPAAPLKQGAKLDLPIKVVRLYGYADPIQLKLLNPPGGITAAAATIAQGELQGTLAIEAKKEAAPGAHKLTVQAIPKFNGTDLPVAQEIELTIEKAE